MIVCVLPPDYTKLYCGPYAAVVAAVTAVNDYQKQLQFEKLNAIAQGSEQAGFTGSDQMTDR